MKLNAKFQTIIISLLVTAGIIIAFMFLSFVTLMNLKEYEIQAVNANTIVQKLVGYNDAIFARRFSWEAISSDWEKLRAEADVTFDSLRNEKILSNLGEDLAKKVTSVLNTWDYIQPAFNDLSTQYDNLVNNSDIDPTIKISVKANGLLEGVRQLKGLRETAPLENAIYNISTAQNKVLYINETFNKILSDLCTELKAFCWSSYYRFLALSVVIIVVAAITIFIVTAAVTGKITKRIMNIKNASQKLASKDFTVNISDSRKDEVGDLARELETTVTTLDEILQEVKRSAAVSMEFGTTFEGASSQTAAATHQIRTSIESLNRQFEILEEAVKSSMDKLMHMSDIALTLVVDNQQQFDSISQNSSDITKMAKLVNTITDTSVEKSANAERIQQFVVDGDSKISATTELLSQITNQLDEIGEIIEIINGVAEQTNILSMNAAIESAHAGEAGKGFSVVAEEIRNLAESTADNAQRIGQSINAIVRKVKDADKTSCLAAEAFARVSEQAQDMSNSLHIITNDLRSVDAKITEVDKRTHSVADTAAKISAQCDQLNIQQIAVSESMAQMHGIFSESKTGVNEIRSGASDIVEKMLQVSELSAESSNNMKSLSEELAAFVTTDLIIDADPDRSKPVDIPDLADDAALAFAEDSAEDTIKQNEAFAMRDMEQESIEPMAESEPASKKFDSEPDNDNDLLEWFNS